MVVKIKGRTRQTTTTHVKSNDEKLRALSGSSSEIGGDPMLGEGTRVGAGLGMTIPMPVKFEMARVDVSIDVPCSIANRDRAFEMAMTWTEARLRDAVQRVRRIAEEVR